MVKALVFLAPGFEEIEASTIIDVLRRGNIEVVAAGLKPEVVEGAHGMKVVPDQFVDEVAVEKFDAVICPGGAPGYENLRKNPKVVAMVKDAFRLGKLIAAICAGPTVLSDAGVLKGRKCTVYPGLEGELKKGGGKPVRKNLVVVDGNIVTSKGPATALPFALKLTEKLAGKETARKIRKETLANLVLK